MTLKNLIDKGLLEKINQIDVCGPNGRYIADYHGLESRWYEQKNVDVLTVDANQTEYYFLLDEEVQLTDKGLYARCSRRNKTIELMFVVNAFFNPSVLLDS